MSDLELPARMGWIKFFEDVATTAVETFQKRGGRRVLADFPRIFVPATVFEEFAQEIQEKHGALVHATAFHSYQLALRAARGRQLLPFLLWEGIVFAAGLNSACLVWYPDGLVEEI